MPQESLITIATRHQSHLERLKTHEVNKFDSFLVQMSDDIGIALSEVGDLDTMLKLEKLQGMVDSAMKLSFDEYGKVWRASVRELSIYEAGFEIKALESVVTGVAFTLPSDAIIVAAVNAAPLGDITGATGGKLLKPFYSEFAKDERDRMQRIIRLGFAEGQTNNQILDRIRGTEQASYKDGELARIKRGQESITRTALQHAANQAREEVWQNNKKVISKIRISATLDKKTSGICRGLDGKEFPVDKGIRPPFHIRCRTTTVAVLDDKFKALSKGRMRSMRDPETGEVSAVSANTSYYGWLKDQPANVQDSIIGESRGKLLRNGGLSSKRFTELQLSKDFKPLNLEQMRKLEPAAFEKAGL